MGRIPKYSVIIPVYNAEKTLRRCVDSLLNQNYSDLELILVNDGSLDGSIEICSEYQTRNDCIQVIDKTNGGVSSARNAGLDSATGEYILFVDSDDYVSEDYFQKLDALCTEVDYDCVFFSQNIVEGTNVRKRELEKFFSQDTDQCVTKFCEAYYRKYLNPPHNKRYLRCIIEENHLRFPEKLSIGEDKVFCLQYALFCKSCCITSEALYNVCIDNHDSLSRKPRKDLQQQFAIIDEMVNGIIYSATISERHRQQYIAAENLIKLRAVYSEAKRLHLAGQPRHIRRETIRRMCMKLNSRKLILPAGNYSILLQVPVKMKFVLAIDFAGWYLSR